MISIGGVCCVAYHLRKKGIVSEAYPFDWIKIGMGDLIKLFERDFKDFTNKKHFFPIKTSDKHSVDSGDSIITGHKKYPSIRFCHDFNTEAPFEDQLNGVMEKYTRRVERLREFLYTNSNMVFVRYQTKNVTEDTFRKFKEIVQSKYDITVELRVVYYFPKKLPTKIKFWIDNKVMDDWKTCHLPWKEILS